MTLSSKESSKQSSGETIVLCDIYKGNKKEEMYLYVNKTDGLDRMQRS